MMCGRPANHNYNVLRPVIPRLRRKPAAPASCYPSLCNKKGEDAWLNLRARLGDRVTKNLRDLGANDMIQEP